MPMPAVDDFLRSVLKSGLLEREQLGRALRGVPPEKRTDPLAVAEALVQAGLLWHYQATMLLRGTYNGLKFGPYRILRPIANREDRVGELRLREREEKVRLILRRVDAALEHVAAHPRVVINAALDARVVSGRDRVGAEPLRSIDERRELQIAVAVRAGKRRTARGVLANEVRHDLLVELPLEVDDVVRDADSRCDAPRIVQIVDRTAAAERGLTLRLVIELHGQTDDVMALLGEQRRGHRRIDTA